MKPFSLSVFAGALTALSLMGLGCNPLASVQDKIAEKATESIAERVLENAGGENVDVDLSRMNNEGGVTIRDNKTGDFFITGVDIKIPDEFPKDTPRYPGAKTISVTFEKKSNSGSLIQQTADDVPKVAVWFSAELKAAGFTIENEIDAGTSKILVFKKGNVTITVNLIRDTDGKQTTIQTARQQEGS